MKKQLLLTIYFCCLTVLMFSQGTIEFDVQTNAKKVVEGGVFQVIFQVENASLDNFKPPKFEHFQLLSGPGRSSQVLMVNGKVSRSEKINYQLRAKEVGTFKIGAASIKVNGKTYKTSPLTIEVVEGSGEEENVESQFARFELNKTEAYIGEQVIGELKVYSQYRISNASFSGFLEIENAYNEPLFGQNTIQQGLDVVNGKQYYTYVIQKFSIFPQQSGDLSIEPISTYLETYNFERYNLLTESVSLRVKALEDKPEGFSEAVGKFNFEVILNKEKLSTDETTTLVVNIVGTGDIKRIEPFDLEGLQEYFDIYEPTVDNKSVMQNGMMISQRLMTYVLAPKKVARLQYSQGFTYFDTDVNNFISLSSDTFNIVITQGKEQEMTMEDFSEQDIYPIISTENRFLSWNLFGSVLFWILLTLPFCVLMILLVTKKLKRKKAKNKVLSKGNNIDKIALARLEQANIYLKKGEQRLFYNEINQSLFRYISDKFSISFSELSKENIRLRLEEQQIKTVTIDKFISILNTCELALFAGIGKSEDMQITYDSAKLVIVEIEN